MKDYEEAAILVSHQKYPSDVASAIFAISPLAVDIANRWMMGWPKRVKALLAEGTYLELLRAQERQERNVLATATGASHLARHELMEEYGLSPAPPF